MYQWNPSCNTDDLITVSPHCIILFAKVNICYLSVYWVEATFKSNKCQNKKPCINLKKKKRKKKGKTKF